MGKKLRYVVHTRDGRLTLTLAGDMDGASAAELCCRIEGLGVSVCGLDFSQVEAIDLFGARPGPRPQSVAGAWRAVGSRRSSGGDGSDILPGRRPGSHSLIVRGAVRPSLPQLGHPSEG